MKLGLIVTLLISCVCCWANWQWGNSFGSGGAERVWSMTSDALDNIYIVGDFTDSLYVGGQVYPGYGLTDSFVISYYPDGGMSWAKSFGSPQEDSALDTAIDAEGNLYVCGYFIDSLSIDDQTVTSSGLWDAYIAKFTNDGELLWLTSFGGVLNDIAYGIAVTGDRIYITGWFADTINFSDELSISSSGGSDVYCLALSTDGEFAWVRKGGSVGVEYGFSVSSDQYGNAYILGVAGADALFDTQVLGTAGLFVAKYNHWGDLQWLSNTQASSGSKIVVDRQIDPEFGLVSGRLDGSGSFGDISYNTWDGSSDAYSVKFSLDTGDWQDLHLYGAAGDDRARACDYYGYPVITGSFEQTVDFGSGIGISNGDMDLFLLASEQSLCLTAGGEYNESPSAVRILSSGSIAVAGWHSGSFRVGSFLLDAGTNENMNGFIAVYNPTTNNNSQSVEHTPQASLLAYPNPFSNHVNIRSVYPDRTNGKLTIYNIRGQKVVDLSESINGNFTWDGKDTHGNLQKTGVYFVRDANTGISRRLLLLEM